MAVTKTCALVVRVSDSRQAITEKNSIDIQVDELKKYIEVKNCDPDGPRYIEGPLYDLTGISGQDSFNSKEFERLQMDLILGKIQVVMCTALDRLGRDVMGFVNFFHELKAQKAELICTRMSLDTSSPTGEAMAIILMALAQLELNIKSERNRRGTWERAKKGFWNGGRPILGYDLSEDPLRAGRPLVNKDEAVIVQTAFNEYLKLGSDREVAKLLKSLGYKNKRWKRRSTGKWYGGRDITPAVVKQMLTNITYIAQRRYSEKDDTTGEIVTRVGSGLWKPIISVELFDKVQELRKVSKRKRKNVTGGVKPKSHFYLLIEIAVCKYCEGPMTSRSGTSQYQEQVHYSYTCKNNDCAYHIERIGQIPNRNHANADDADAAAYGVLDEIVNSSEYLGTFTRNLNEMILRELPELRGKLRGLTKASSEAERDILDLTKALPELSVGSKKRKITENKIDSLTRVLDRVAGERDALMQKIGMISKRKLSPEEVKARLNSMRRLASTAPENQRRELVKYVFEKVVMTEETLEFHLRVDGIGYQYDLLTRGGRFEHVDNWRLVPLPARNSQHLISRSSESFQTSNRSRNPGRHSAIQWFSPSNSLRN